MSSIDLAARYFRAVRGERDTEMDFWVLSSCGFTAPLPPGRGLYFA